jgi:micrococcal nuclease
MRARGFSPSHTMAAITTRHCRHRQQHRCIHMAKKAVVSKAVSLKDTAPSFKDVASTLTGMFAMLTRELSALNRVQKIMFATIFVAGVLVGRTKPFWRRFTDVMEIPGSFFGPTAPRLSGRAVSVSDGDTIRFLHVPTWWSETTLGEGEKVSSLALPVRICTIDTPETPKFGKPGQPFGLEAKEYLKGMLGREKRVHLQLLQKDQYGRVVAQVFTQGLLGQRKYVDEEMLKAGLAEVYRGGGAVYGPKGMAWYELLEKGAQDKKLGIWSQGPRESAAEYKKRTK